jgi:ABC-type Fe3+/spermidine/putrescine transport system ATPase subunit
MGLEIKNVVKKFGNKQILHDISFEVPDNSFVSLLGPSGCGKTTLLNMVAGLVDLDGGEIRLDGTLLSSASFALPPEKRKIGMVFQDFALWPHMTAFQNVAFGLQMEGLKGKEIKERVHDTLAIFHMESHAQRYPSELSGGQKQRISMARAIAPLPKLILMDEPLSSLDAQLREEMRWELLRIFHQFKITTLYVTHDQIEAMSMSDMIVLLKDGKIEQQDAPETMYYFPKTTFAARFLDATNEFSGQILKIDHDLIEVKTSAGVLKANGISGIAEGQSVTWLCRPHDLEPIRNEDMGEDPASYNDFAVKILFRSFQGRVWRYIGNPVESANSGTTESHRVEFSSSKPYKIGDVIALRVLVQACKVLPEDPGKARSKIMEQGA